MVLDILDDMVEKRNIVNVADVTEHEDSWFWRHCYVIPQNFFLSFFLDQMKFDRAAFSHKYLKSKTAPEDAKY